MQRSASSPRLRLICLIICLSLVTPPSLFAPASASTTGGARNAEPERPPLPAPAHPVGRQDDSRGSGLLARFRDGVSEAQADSIAASYSLRRDGKLRGPSGVERLTLLPGQTLDMVLPALRSDPSVEYAEPNYFITADQARANDPHFPEQWALGGARGKRAGVGVNAAAAWSQTTGSPATIIAVIDSGVDFTHPDLRDNLWTNAKENTSGGDQDADGYAGDLHGWDWVTDSAPSRDDSGHGTAVAGLIAAVGNNDEGIAGVMWRASLMSLRVLDKENKGTVADAVEAIDYAVAHGARVINCSWGLNEPSIALRRALERAVKHNVTVVLSAGNGGHDVEQAPRYPAAYDLPFLISVAATGKADELTPSSNWGAMHVAIGAPGEGLLTTKAGGGYELFSGTSAAAAVVSGVAGLVRTLRPGLSAARTEQMILGGARKVPALEGKVMSNGVADAAGALALFTLLQQGEGLGNGEERGNGAETNGDAELKDADVSNARPLGTGNGAEALSAPRKWVPDADDLPDLRMARTRSPHEPRAIPSIPSTRRRCPPRNPRCNENVDAAPGATPTSTPIQPPVRAPKEKAAAPAPAPPISPADALSLASVTAPPLWPLPATGSGRSTPTFDFSLLDFYRSDGGYGRSDVSAAGPLAGLWGSYVGGAFPLVALLQSGATNLAQGKAATQSTTFTALSPNGDAWRAVDGNTDGGYFNGSITHTNGDAQPWWQVDLGAVFSIGNIDLWNRTDCCADRLTGFYVFVSDVPFTSNNPTQTQAQAGVWTVYTAGQAPTHSTLTVNRTGRYVRVQLASTSPGVLSLAEVQVFAGEPQAVPPQGIPSAESVAWTNAVGVTPSGNSLTKSAAAGWDAGAMSTKAIASGDGYAEFTVSETSTNRMFGLSHGNSDQSYTDIDFAIHTQAGGALYVFEAGNNKGQFGTCATGDRLRVSVTGGVVSYSKNGVTLYTSAVAPRYPLLVDTSLYEQGTTLSNALISGALVENVVWTNVAGVSAAGNNLTRGTGGAWNAGASSTRVIAGGDGYAEFTVLETTSDRMFGLSRGDSNQDYTDIDFAIYAAGNGQLYLYEGGVYRAGVGGYANGDRLRVSVEGGQVRYRRNGALLYTSAVAPQYPLLVDTSFYGSASTVFNAVLSAPLSSQIDPGGIGLTGRYYDNVDFTNFALTRLDYTVNYDWAGGSPSPSMGVDDFSVRWTGMVVPRYTETYTFYTTTDDGVRLWVDGQLIIDRWQDQAPYEATGTIALEAGRQYIIRMEFYERAGGAMAWLKWSSISQAKEFVPQSRLLPCWKSVEQFVTDFYQAVLRRAPSSYELQDWTERLTQAQGESQQIAVAQALGRTLLNSTEYAALNPSDNHRFVSDLYWGYMQRAPDAGGWSWWESEVNAHGRGHGIVAFEDSIEFKEKVLRLCGTAASSGTNGGDGYNFAAARLDPSNRTGSGGADSYSRNYNFQIPLVSLPGRAGLDLGLMLSYNSLVWTKDGTGVTFDADRGTPSPGFRLGFPTLQPKFYNPQTQKNAYLLITPAGGRVELRQVGTSNVYEAADSSYLQLTEGGTPTLTTTDGTQISFTAAGGEWRCSLVKDRNGNYINAAYYGDGRIQSVTDTLGRTLTFNYDNYQNLLSITQPWRRDTETNPNPTQDETHSWATFGYANVTLLPQFSNLAVIGEQPGTVIPALTQVGLDDGSYYKFSYNQWGQVWKVTHYAADSVSANGQPNDAHPLTSTRIDLPGSDLQAASAQTDCPRFTQERTWIENGVMNQSDEVVIGYSAWAPNMASCDVTAPDGTLFKDIYGVGWQKGLTTQSEVWSAGQRKKWTTALWEHHGAADAPYPTNPRIKDTTVNDAEGHHRRTSVTYQTFTLPDGASCSLPQEVTEYNSNTTTTLRTTRTEYNLSTEYLNRRIIGLPSFQYIYEGAAAASNMRSKVGYFYDDSTLSNYLQPLPPSVAATQHDGTNYGIGLRWRGNVNRVRRYELNTQTWAETGSFTETQSGFNVTGTTAFMTDALGHPTTLDYTDSFYPGINRSNPALQTFAYPTSAAVQEQNPTTTITASTQYNYDLGVATRSTNPKNTIVKTFYDSAGRVKSVTRRDGVNNVDKGYTRWVYPAKMDVVQTFVLTDATKPEAYSAKMLDGAGRVRATASDHLGRDGVWGYSAQFFDFDAVGRVVRQSNPTETDASGPSWAATGDDAPANGGLGWVYTTQAYDWKGRPTVTTNPDSTTRTVSYGGCGCAGGEVVTLTDEAGHKQRATSDVLGRQVTLEDLNPNDTVYRTTSTSYNVLDQVTQVVEQIGTNGTAQTTTTEYDGYGRAWKSFFPQATAPIIFQYYADDSLHVRTDARGATATYTYYNRGLTKTVTYALGADVWGVSYGYDSAGNRTSMTDGMGSVTYNYDTLSRLTSETRSISELGRSFTTTYDYNLADELTLVRDHFGSEVTYTRDRTGRVTDIPGYTTGIKYRAWGAPKEQSLANGRAVSMSYNARMQVSQFNVPGVTGWQYQYYGDGRLQFAGNLQQQGTRDERLDRKLVYDVVGRLSVGTSGSDARGESGFNTGPYRQTYGHDMWDHLTFRDNLRGNVYSSYSAPYVNNRNQNTGWQYNANGTLTRTQEGSSTAQYTYNCAEHMTSAVMSTPTSTTTILYGYDGDGQRVKKVETNVPTTYYVRSSAIRGQVLDEVDSSGNKLRGYVYQEGNLIAKQEGAQTQWDVRDPANFSTWMLNSSGGVASHVELDPLGTTVDPNNTSYSQNPAGFYGSASLQGSYCRVNGLGIAAPCSLAEMLNSHGFNQMVTVNGEQMPLNMAQGMADIGRISPNDIVFGNPWDLNNLLPRMTFRESAPAPPGTVSARGPYVPPPAGTSPGPAARSFFFNWGAFHAGFLWMSGYGSNSRAEFASPGAFIKITPPKLDAIAGDPRPTKEQQDIFDEAYKRMRAILDQKDGVCASLFGGRKAALKALGTIRRWLVTDIPPQDGYEVIAGAGKIEDNYWIVKINSKTRAGNGFFEGAGSADKFGAAAIQENALTLLHELGHVAGVLEDDKNNSQASDRNDAKVREACGGAPGGRGGAKR